ncbi:MAG: immunity 21 family protein [Gemmatimonadaceae bacterium]
MTEWVTRNGGPLILLEESLLSHWSGTDAPRDGRALDTRFRLDILSVATDYDRACSVEGPVAWLDVGPGGGLVLGGEPLDTTWVRSGHDEGYLVRWIAGDSDDTIDATVASAPSRLFIKTDVQIDIRGPMRLFDSAFPGDQIVTLSTVVDVPSGAYAVSTAEYSPDARTSLLLHRLRRTA